LPNELTEMKVEILKALAQPIRLRIVESLRNGEKCVGEISQLFDCDRTTISKHLSILKNAKILKARKDSLNVYYRLNFPCIVDVFKCIENVINEAIKQENEVLIDRKSK